MMTKTATALMGVVVALATAAAFAPSSYARDLTSDEAYCRQLIKEYTYGGMPRSAAVFESLRTKVAIDQCRSGNPEPAIPVLQQVLRNQGFTVPPRS
jgi:hypothetical protein